MSDIKKIPQKEPKGITKNRGPHKRISDATDYCKYHYGNFLIPVNVTQNDSQFNLLDRRRASPPNVVDRTQSMTDVPHHMDYSRAPSAGQSLPGGRASMMSNQNQYQNRRDSEQPLSKGEPNDGRGDSYIRGGMVKPKDPDTPYYQEPNYHGQAQALPHQRPLHSPTSSQSSKMYGPAEARYPPHHRDIPPTSTSPPETFPPGHPFAPTPTSSPASFPPSSGHAGYGPGGPETTNGYNYTQKEKGWGVAPMQAAIKTESVNVKWCGACDTKRCALFRSKY